MLIGCSGTGEAFVLRDVRGAEVVRVELQLAPGEQLDLVAVPSAGSTARPVLHLWDPASKRELARGQRQAWPRSREARVVFRNSGAGGRKLWLIARADAADGGGVIDVVRDGKVLARGARIDGAPIAIAHGGGYTYYAAAEPAGPQHATLYALAADGRLLAVAERGGPTGLPRLSGNAWVRSLLVAAPAAHAGLVVVASDPEDRDHDGLGRQLEHALGTCDAADDAGCAGSALAKYYTTVKGATRDSDRDGLPDRDELLGVAGAPPLDLPRWGADPRHKDVFVEVDRHRRADDDALSEDDYVQVQALFSAGPAGALRNPDGKPGVHMHFDVGFSPVHPEHAALLGDWGGSNLLELRDYRKGRKTDFAPARAGYFRYALLSRQGTGQAHGDAFTINRDYHRVQVFAHELAHTLGLQHEGDARWGKANCKPSYFSIMNYVFQNRDDIGFSRGGTLTLDATKVIEARGLGGRDASFLRDPPYELDVVDQGPVRGVDWNRDGIISREPVRAGVLFATYKSCGASTVARATLAKEHVAAATPVLARAGSTLWALWIDDRGQVLARGGKVSGPDAQGSCPRGDSDRAGCMTFGEAQALEDLHANVKHVAALAASSSEVVLAYVTRDGVLRVATLLSSGPEHALAVESDGVVPGIVTHDAPSLAYLPMKQAWGVWARAADGGGRIVQATARDPRGPWQLDDAVDSFGRTLFASQGPSMLVLGTGELCGAWPDLEGFVRFHCLDASAGTWLDLTQRAFDAALGPSTSAPVALAYHRYRDATGAPIAGDDSRGAVYLVFTEPAPGTAAPPDNPNLFISEWLSAEHGAREQLHFRWRGTLDSQWTHIAEGSAIALYEDDQLSALKALLPMRDTNGGQHLELFPLADGVFTAKLSGGNDFEVMERGICSVLRGDTVCGDASTGAY